MKSNKKINIFLIIVIGFFFFSKYYSLVLASKNHIQGKYTIKLAETDNLKNAKNIKEEYSLISTYLNSTIEIINSNKYPSIERKDKFIITLGKFNNRRSCEVELQKVINQFLSTAQGIFIDSSSSPKIEYIKLSQNNHPISIESNAINFQKIFVVNKKAIIHNYPSPSFESKPFLLENDTVFCFEKVYKNKYCYCKYSGEKKITKGFINLTDLNIIDDIRVSDLIQENQDNKTLLFESRDSVSKLLFKSDSLENFINNHNGEFIDCDVYNTLKIKSNRKDSQIFISTKSTNGEWSKFKKYICNRKVSKGFNTFYELEINRLTIYQIYATNKEGDYILATKTKPLISSTCNLDIIIIPKE